MATEPKPTKGGHISYESRLRMRTIPMFPLTSSRHPKSAGNYSNVKSKLPTRDNIHHIPGGGSTKITAHKKVDYTSIKPRIDSKSNMHHKPLLSSIELYQNDVTRFKHVAAKVDHHDPCPWTHHPRHTLDELVELDGFQLNPRFDGVIKSHSFDSIGQLLNYFEKELAPATSSSSDDDIAPVIITSSNERPLVIPTLNVSDADIN